MAKLKLPRTIFVKVEKDGENSYLVASDVLDDLVEMGPRIKIGTYRLVESANAETAVRLTGKVAHG